MILGQVLVHIDNYNFTNFYLIQMEKQNSTDQCLFKNDANEKKGTNGSKKEVMSFSPKKLKQSPETLTLMNGGLKMS